jgi:hypothetical protein
MKSRFRQGLSIDNLKHIPGWRTHRKIVIVESDDWGSIRMPSREAYKRLLRAGLNLNGGDGLRFSLYDSLEGKSDLLPLLEILYKTKDSHGTSAKVTTLNIVANPDFDKIQQSGFQAYSYESVSDTTKRYLASEGIFDLWNDGISSQVFFPQFHGREHLNIAIWLNALKANDHETHEAFKERMWSFIPKFYEGTGLAYESAFQLSDLTSIVEHIEIINDGLRLFESLFRYRPNYFVPPNGKINNRLNYSCYNNGIKFRSVSSLQSESIEGGNNRKTLHWLGQSDTSGIKYIIRNCIFEPSKPGKDWVDSCLNDMKIAFRWHKPAIISTHRVNYIGVHDAANRDNGIKQLSRLLKAIVKFWPDVEFMTTPELGFLMHKK